MRLLHSQIFRSFSSKSLTTSKEISISNEVINIIQKVDPLEPALDKLVHFLCPNTISSILELQQQKNPELGFRFFIWAAKRRRFRSWVSQNLIIDMLLKDGGFDLYWNVFDKLNIDGIPISSDAFAALIWGYWKVNKAEKAVEAFGKMKDFDCKPNLFTYNMILHITVRKDSILLALAVYNVMLKVNSMPNCSTFSILIDGLCKSGRTHDALKLFDEMCERGVLPSKITYTVILSGLCQAKRTDDAHRLLNVMKSRGCLPDFVTYNALLNGFCKLGRIDEAQALLRSFENEGYLVDIKGYTCLIDGFVRTKRIDEAQSVFKKLFENNTVPDVVLYTTMIRGLSGEGRVKEALSLLRDMTGRGVQPDTQCYNTLIKGFCDMGLLDQARSLQLEISENDCFPDTCTYSILICGMCRNGLVEEARHIFNEMEKLGCFPSVVTFNTLIDGLCKAGELEEAHLMFYKMEIGKNPSLFLRLSQGADRVLDSASLQKMVEKLCESGKILKAYKLLMQLADCGVVPNIVTYNILINGLCKSGKINGAFKLFEELQVKGHFPDSITYGTLIDGLQRVDREEEAFKLLDQMSKNGCMPKAEVYKSLMTWSCRRGQISIAFSLWLKYLRNQAVRDGKVLGLIEKHLEKGDLENVVRGLLEMDLKLEDFDSSPYNIWLIGMCQARKPGEALKIFSLLEEFHVMISAPSCVMLIHSLCEEGNLDQAIEVFLYTVERGVRLMPRICNKLLQSLLHSQDKAQHAVDLLERMRSVGYNLNDYLHSGTRSLFQRWNRRETENLSPG
ncbi:pentatricopeptide repeat-containing protein At1g79540 [Lycium ferocissimum]|uniref:pentatricopeptide repeat-containing protein At1g79540 n=1 Tax=Lycium ferocissimum TaxID=112874 RepID=UPI0028154DCF|nr:pentatricopeptide repeat-containing protein At1g79540 [Lycium ferocissimum]XP_059280363.1 pentatricopeptide repeat-containing protein At1g79540 [Lycium ferocissimum]XP_059280364.1 pentatricopeptide repeat-containing protein At1g79540 [Lycium ferocissimum]XP_059280367.1 pentatricopeptide repeat-containing protein At1g79540 [Lycium ferocissimum]XP_059280368.1 pentatricopeptide repeat-containing protein At1g79540 [Lycium ferocissimum]XP_059280369.1 pentatricopeptide repeat-containing protein A